MKHPHNTLKRLVLPAIALASITVTPWATAQHAGSEHSHATPSASSATTPASTAANTASTPSTATIKRVDDKRRKLLLQHGPIENLGMSAMTMGFDVAPGVDITGLTAGDTILFRAEQIKGQYTVTEIRKP